MTKKISGVLILILVSIQLSANDYNARRKAACDSVWSQKIPMFNIRTVPSQYSNESAVILAEYEDISAIQKTKFRFTSQKAFNKELNFKYIQRRMIKIQDKASLENYSEFSFKEKEGNPFGSLNSILTFIGARIIKPDGTIKEVDITEAVSIEEDKKGRDVHKKLAIPDLQIGDILDYFIEKTAIIDQSNIPQLEFFLQDRYPKLNYKVHCEVNNNLTVEYKSINGAPDFTKTTNEDITNLDIEKTNLPKYERTFWKSTYLQTPAIRLNILNNKSAIIYKPSSARKAGIYPNINAKEILIDNLNTIGDYVSASNIRASSNTKSYIKKYIQQHPQATKVEIADYIYNVARLIYPQPQSDISTYWFISYMNYLFSKYDITHYIGFSTESNGVRKDELMCRYDLTPVIATKEGRVYTAPQPYSFAGENPASIENGTAFVTIEKGGFTEYTANTTIKEITVPVTSCMHNFSKSTFNISVDDFNNDEIQVSSLMEAGGHLKAEKQYRLLNWYNADKAFRTQLGITDDYFTEYNISGKEKTNLETQISDFDKSQKDSVIRDLNDYFGTKIKNLNNYKIVSNGNTSTDSIVKYEASFSMEGLIKRAGNNYIMSVGKLIGEQLQIDDDDRKRSIDVYMPFNRSFEQIITIRIPAGYKVESLNNLTYNIDNEYTGFISQPVFADNTLTIRVLKSYKKTFVPIKDWAQVVSVIDAANTLYTQSVLIKKL